MDAKGLILFSALIIVCLCSCDNSLPKKREQSRDNPPYKLVVDGYEGPYYYQNDQAYDIELNSR